MNESPTQKLLQRLELKLLEPETRASAELLIQLLADEFVEFGSSGRVSDKQQTIAALLNEGSGPRAQRGARDFRVTLLADDAALLTYRAVRFHLNDSTEIHTLPSSIWKHQEGRWRMMFHQGTRNGGAI